MWLTLAAMRNAIAVLMASLAIVLLGATSLSRMPIDPFPNINFPSIRIGTIYKGANVQDVERTVEAVQRAGRTRPRPILMTSLTTLAGLFPMALGIDVGSEANAPLARAVIGGLAVSTMLTLLLIPTLYVTIDERFPRRIAAPDAALALEGETR